MNFFRTFFTFFWLTTLYWFEFFNFMAFMPYNSIILRTYMTKILTSIVVEKLCITLRKMWTKSLPTLFLRRHASLLKFRHLFFRYEIDILSKKKMTMHNKLLGRNVLFAHEHHLYYRTCNIALLLILCVILNVTWYFSNIILTDSFAI